MILNLLMRDNSSVESKYILKVSRSKFLRNSMDKSVIKSLTVK